MLNEDSAEIIRCALSCNRHPQVDQARLNASISKRRQAESLLHIFVQADHLPLFSKLKNSSLVFALLLIAPSIQLVVVLLCVFCTPLMTIHK